MNSLEHIAFVLTHAVEKDEVSKADLLRFCNVLHTIAHEVADTGGLEQLNTMISARFHHVIHPSDAEWAATVMRERRAGNVGDN
jgi:hypothetical protein